MTSSEQPIKGPTRLGHFPFNQKFQLQIQLKVLGHSSTGQGHQMSLREKNCLNFLCNPLFYYLVHLYFFHMEEKAGFPHQIGFQFPMGEVQMQDSFLLQKWNNVQCQIPWRKHSPRGGEDMSQNPPCSKYKRMGKKKKKVLEPVCLLCIEFLRIHCKIGLSKEY